MSLGANSCASKVDLQEALEGKHVSRFAADGSDPRSLEAVEVLNGSARICQCGN